MDALNIRELLKSTNSNPVAVETYTNYLQSDKGKTTIKNLLEMYPEWDNAGSTDRNNFIDAVTADMGVTGDIKTAIEDMIIDRIIRA